MSVSLPPNLFGIRKEHTTVTNLQDHRIPKLDHDHGVFFLP